MHPPQVGLLDERVLWRKVSWGSGDLASDRTSPTPTGGHAIKLVCVADPHGGQLWRQVGDVGGPKQRKHIGEGAHVEDITGSYLEIMEGFMILMSYTTCYLSCHNSKNKPCGHNNPSFLTW